MKIKRITYCLRGTKVLYFMLSLCLMQFFSNATFAQQKLEFDGQASTIFSFSPENDLDFFAGARYLPNLSYQILTDSVETKKFFDFEAAANFSGSVSFHPFDTSLADGNITPYRLWARFSRSQYEIRVGLQKIDFGAASILRPLQWFNQIDPRDPLQLTNGVYGALGRYYFLNNTNVWLWVLIGNEKTRGFDAIETNKKIPEFGGRIQYPVPKGELALSYHYRTANSSNLLFVQQYDKIPENRIGIDGKWDLKVGLWFEATFSQKAKNLEQFTNQTLFNIGTDYTFGLGNGLNLIAEHLLASFDQKAFGFENTANITALTASYPLTFFDNLNTVMFYNWSSEDFTFFINYQHQFKHITGYLMAYYNPNSQQGIQQNDLINNFSGPGIRLMIVYNH